MKKALIFLGGFISGGLIGAIGMREYILKTLKDMPKYQGPKPIHVNKKDILEVVDFDPSQRKKETKIEKPELDQLVKKYKPEETDYTNPSFDQIDETEEEEDEDNLYPEDDEPEEEELHEPEFSSPQIISLTEFDNDKKHYETATLTYYTYDDTVVDEEENVITSPEDLIGDDALLCFGLGSDDPNTVYICNDQRGTKYEVVKVNGSYQEIVLGIKEDYGGPKKMRREDIDSD